ncbi:hypothetical protein D8674_003604 [Pyrus ussuriensis x Pyrus communis]|uniref:Uncharacterized protein n=1 Tax=Pyrus ussuriensis x Pyrus communis TaxID=2448454 RepID=A0A5N5FHJ5_9ROSA|nr:hypothetical protein D8674_003604 [Pyrus ussuriensis x Pyrus communis]
MIKKAIQKAMKNLKGSKSKSTSSSPSNDNETVVIISKLRDVEEITLAVFKSFLSFISGPKSKPGSWSLVSKMIPTNKVSCDEETKANEFAQEEGLESLFRQMIKTRVSLLNILNH